MQDITEGLVEIKRTLLELTPAINSNEITELRKSQTYEKRKPERIEEKYYICLVDKRTVVGDIFYTKDTIALREM